MIRCNGCARRREALRRMFLPKQKKAPDMPKQPEALRPDHVILQRQASGEYAAIDKRNGRVVSNGFDDEEDFETWKRDYFAISPK